MQLSFKYLCIVPSCYLRNQVSSFHVHWYQSLQILSSIGREASGTLGLWLALVDPPVSDWLVLLCMSVYGMLVVKNRVQIPNSRQRELCGVHQGWRYRMALAINPWTALYV